MRDAVTWIVIALLAIPVFVAGIILITAYSIADRLDEWRGKASLLFLIAAMPCMAQPALYVQGQAGQENTAMIQIEERVSFSRDRYMAVVQYGIGTDYTPGYRAFARMGFGKVIGNISVWLYMPWMNFKQGEGYNTPLSAEVFYRDRISAQIDGYADGVALSVKVRRKLL